ncbi:hypothetical protein [Entomobacter blattae]|uniref:Uncharacterized protein n=1 Tax=Entomobacter blattae TaxID=2762277 RepID=A0A7H1NQW4_9PROT|nr:hypothetical protein [Entomobacter blattae]QNT78174.1 hypothetical protein JGUZn3_09430 [Entomobacter blattae]
MDASQLAWLATHHPDIYLLITLLPVFGMFILHALHSVIRLYFDYKRQKFMFEREVAKDDACKDKTCKNKNNKG